MALMKPPFAGLGAGTPPNPGIPIIAAGAPLYASLAIVCAAATAAAAPGLNGLSAGTTRATGDPPSSAG